MLSGHDIVCISTQDWDDLWTRKQRFMSQFAKQGNKVLYVERQMHLAGAVKRIKTQWRRSFKWLNGPRMIAQNLYVYTLPLVLPFYQMAYWINGINHYIIISLLKRQMASLGLRNPILWTYAPFSDRLIGKLGEKLVVYECVDEFSASKGLVRANVIKAMESCLIKKSDLIIVTAQSLLDSKRHLSNYIHLVPNAAEVDHFKKVLSGDTVLSHEMAQIKPPIIGFLGSISYWIDIDLIHYIAVSRPDWSVVMIGPVRTDISKITALPNVYILGRKDYNEVPGYVKGFDVCINPYIMDGVAEGCSPLKLYEYLATGKPIVSVDMPEARKFSSIITIARSYEEFLTGLDSSFKENGKYAKERIAESEKHSWDNRFQRVQFIVEEALKNKVDNINFK
jgi:glycosyltransferase involved in cell wall biosynthesis